ncbi:MAG: hypothetical protein IKT40_13400 [Bacilli bacterium]|nr:hypothetical protein [Bacilli bacterium]
MMIDLDDYTFECHPLFDKEFSKIIRKHQCPTLMDDFNRLKIILVQDLLDNDNFSHHICTRIKGLDSNVPYPAFIIKNFRCKGINKGSRSGFRLTFVYVKEENYFYFCEIYNKNKKDVEDKNRINNLFD